MTLDDFRDACALEVFKTFFTQPGKFNGLVKQHEDRLKRIYSTDTPIDKAAKELHNGELLAKEIADTCYLNANAMVEKRKRYTKEHEKN